MLPEVSVERPYRKRENNTPNKKGWYSFLLTANYFPILQRHEGIVIEKETYVKKNIKNKNHYIRIIHIMLISC